MKKLNSSNRTERKSEEIETPLVHPFSFGESYQIFVAKGWKLMEFTGVASGIWVKETDTIAQLVKKVQVRTSPRCLDY